jgi:hypothetical protein
MEKEVKKKAKLYTREDIVHAYTSGHLDSRSGITQSRGWKEYKQIHKI